MLDAVRIAGRWISQHVLDRLSARARGEYPPLRSELVRDFCRATHWHNGKGQLCVSSANVALNRLEKQGRVVLTPPMKRAARARARQWVDDGAALPPLPSLPGSVERLVDLRVQLLAGAKDPEHGLWQRLIVRHHPLAGAPLVGAQLRYLIRSQEGVIGAFGFGPAAFHLECRDQWIGWDRRAQGQHRPRVIGLSRFLLRPGLRCANLASRCYRLVLERVGEDWQERYGVRPLLVETYVDRSTQTGVSLAAANWRRLGQSRGRGRSSGSEKDRPKSIKDVWVRELSPRARAQLQARWVERVAPRSILRDVQAEGWIGRELDGLDLGDARLNGRVERMLEARWQSPQRSFSASFGKVAQSKGAHRLIVNGQAGISFHSLLAPHTRRTHSRMAAEKVVFLAQDTTTLSYNTLLKTRGLGRIGDARHPGRGLLLHSLQAYRLDRIPLGCAWARLWARPESSAQAHRNDQSTAEKESGRWIQAYQAALGAARAMPQTQLIVCGDRESDLFELYDQTEAAPSNLHVLVRVQHDRVLVSGTKLWDHLNGQPSGGRMQVVVPRSHNRPARLATLELQYSQTQINPPSVALKKSWQAIGLYAVMAREIHPPEGLDAIEWVVLTDWPVRSAKMARRIIRWYSLRWGIECWHQILKDLCGVETRQMESAEALGRALVLDMIVAWRAQFLCRLGKENPNLPASLHYTPEELAVLERFKHELPRHARDPVPQPAPEPPSNHSPGSSPQKETPPATQESPRPSTLTLFQANLLVAMRAGFLGRRSDGHPGPHMLGRGLEILSALVHYETLLTQPAGDAALPPRKRPRKPG